MIRLCNEKHTAHTHTHTHENGHLELSKRSFRKLAQRKGWRQHRLVYGYTDGANRGKFVGMRVRVCLCLCSWIKKEVKKSIQPQHKHTHLHMRYGNWWNECKIIKLFRTSFLPVPEFLWTVCVPPRKTERKARWELRVQEKKRKRERDREI